MWHLFLSEILRRNGWGQQRDSPGSQGRLCLGLDRLVAWGSACLAAVEWLAPPLLWTFGMYRALGFDRVEDFNSQMWGHTVVGCLMISLGLAWTAYPLGRCDRVDSGGDGQSRLHMLGARENRAIFLVGLVYFPMELQSTVRTTGWPPAATHFQHLAASLHWSASGLFGMALASVTPEAKSCGSGVAMGLVGHCLMILGHPQVTPLSTLMHRLHIGCLLLAAVLRTQKCVAASGTALFLGGWAFVFSQDGLLEVARQSEIHGYPITVLVLGVLVLTGYVNLFAAAAAAPTAISLMASLEGSLCCREQRRSGRREHASASSEARPLLRMGGPGDDEDEEESL
jgi:hypothetical protein